MRLIQLALLPALLCSTAWTTTAAFAEPSGPPAIAPVPHDDPAAPDPAVIFAPFEKGNQPNATRSGSGLPGPGYWQNRADYTIAASIETGPHVLHGSETIAYTNNSSDPLDVLWVQLDQNIYRADARARFSSRYFNGHTTDGDVIESVSVEPAKGGMPVPVPFLISDTRMQVRLPASLAPHGGRLRLHIAWHHTVPGSWGGRTAVTPTSNGDIYEMGQWFPRMAVYDDLRGWDTSPYLGQEFYLEYGDIDYSVTVPWNFIVQGSGALLNPGQVLTATERARLAQAATSDRTVMIRSPAEVTDPASRPTRSGSQTWHFRMQNTRDVAFAASAAFAWDAARLNLPPVSPAPGAKPIPRLAMSIYPVEAAANWTRSTEYVKHAIEYFSRQWYPFPWPNAINLAGHGAGMEYPGMAFDGIKDHGKELFWITTHELGHNWFPMIVGSNERRDAFMDEGFNTFIDVYASDHFNHGEYAPKRDPEYAPGGGNPADEIIPWLKDPKAPTLLEPPDLVVETYRHPITYFKGSLGLVLLREQILGPDRFDPAFRRYIAAWAYKHPTPYDFFRFMSSEGGENLSWWWRGWYEHNWTLDMGITGTSYPDNDPDHGVTIALHNKGWLLMPATLLVTSADGTATRATVPVEAWMQGNKTSITLPTHGAIRSVVLDPDLKLPDTDRSDNIFDPKP
ncbi:M1 family metallopeptidase [Lichenicola cladoniae]|uniref:M1 family metallopeptidase n=1 Tax=Lichenicola cladoniae TaxID=1484109 RepID=A0A6M8HSV2_9PROT|nr:M1 family metallopeptidase [Lichenicola cladoniae]NPD65667.1 M1 family metallopeptidase [Acetobacteraceae bacterium]QKE91305.1 M1 family metallopeptidase [Lichenicola cladoniae]